MRKNLKWVAEYAKKNPNEKFAIEQVLQLIEKLAFESGKLDEFFEQAERSYKATRESEKIKNPLTDL